MSGDVPLAVIKTFISRLAAGGFKNVQEGVEDLICEGYPAIGVLGKMLDILMDKNSGSGTIAITELGLAQLAVKLAEANKKLLDGADETLTMLSIGSTTSSILAASKRAAAA
jgi:replication factor C subunit 2/4